MTLPILKILQQHTAITGKVGAGKTFAGKGFVEKLLEDFRRVCVIDPTGAWWGLRSSADGKRAGFPVVVFGGEHGDVPIAKNSGPALADLIGTRNIPCIIDLSEMLIGERHVFMTEFAEAIYRVNKTPLHLVIDEADEFIPQNPLPETKRMLHHVDRIIRRGRIKGFMVLMITQRPAVIHKNALTQSNTLIAMRLTSPQDRKAIEAWVEGQGDTQKGKEVLATLARLQRGEGWVWAPELDILHRVQFPRIKTFDSSRAPEHGDVAAEPEKLADVDLAAIKDTFAQAQKEAEANDPKKLQARIRELEDQARRAVSVAIDPAEIGRVREEGRQSGIAEGVLIGRAEGKNALVEELRGRIAAAVQAVSLIEATAQPVMVPTTGIPKTEANYARPMRAPVAPRPAPRHSNGSGASEAMPGPQRKLLTVLAQYPEGRSKKQLAILAGYAHNGGAFNNPLSNLRARGWADGGPDRIRITDDGLTALGHYEPLPTGGDLREYWFTNLDGPPAKLLRKLCEVYPHGLSKDELARRCGYEATGGAFNNPLARLRSLELATGRGGADIRASDDLF